MDYDCDRIYLAVDSGLDENCIIRMWNLTDDYVTYSVFLLQRHQVVGELASEETYWWPEEH